MVTQMFKRQTSLEAELVETKEKLEETERKLSETVEKLAIGNKPWNNIDNTDNKNAIGDIKRNF